MQQKPRIKGIKSKRRNNSNDKVIIPSTERSSKEYSALPEINRTFPYEHPVVVKHNKRKYSSGVKLNLIKRQSILNEESGETSMPEPKDEKKGTLSPRAASIEK